MGLAAAKGAGAAGRDARRLGRAAGGWRRPRGRGCVCSRGCEGRWRRRSQPLSGLGRRGGGFSLFPFPRGSRRGWWVCLVEGEPLGEASFAARSARRPRAAASPSARARSPTSGASSVGCGVLSRLPPSSRGCVCLRRGGGAGALCAQPPVPRGCWSRGSRRLRRDPSWLRHSWSATGLLRTYQLLFFKTVRLPGRSRGGRGCLGLFPMEA